MFVFVAQQQPVLALTLVLAAASSTCDDKSLLTDYSTVGTYCRHSLAPTSNNNEGNNNKNNKNNRGSSHKHRGGGGQQINRKVEQIEKRFKQIIKKVANIKTRQATSDDEVLLPNVLVG